MKTYDSGDWGINFIFSCDGSVILKTMFWSLPASCLAVAVSFLTHRDFDPVILVSDPKSYKDMAQLWVGFSFIVGFLITFRTAKAYSRWWEGATLLQQARGEWVNAFSNCIAFCTANQEKQMEVQNFREYLAFLMSLLFSAALNAITQADNNFEVLSLVELEDETLDYLRECSDQVEVIMCWVQSLVVQQMRGGVLDVPPPVLSRVFQELSRGVVNINNVRKISVFLFPFPYAQLIGALLLMFTTLTPIISGLVMESYLNAFVTTFSSVSALVALNFVAMEIECPFGTDPNDLPMQMMQQYMNRTLELYLEEQTWRIPSVKKEEKVTDTAEESTNGRRSGRVPRISVLNALDTVHRKGDRLSRDSLASSASHGRQAIDFAPRNSPHKLKMHALNSNHSHFSVDTSQNSELSFAEVAYDRSDNSAEHLTAKSSQMSSITGDVLRTIWSEGPYCDSTQPSSFVRDPSPENNSQVNTGQHDSRSNASSSSLRTLTNEEHFLVTGEDNADKNLKTIYGCKILASAKSAQEEGLPLQPSYGVA